MSAFAAPSAPVVLKKLCRGFIDIIAGFTEFKIFFEGFQRFYEGLIAFDTGLIEMEGLHRV